MWPTDSSRSTRKENESSIHVETPAQMSTTPNSSSGNCQNFPTPLERMASSVVSHARPSFSHRNKYRADSCHSTLKLAE